MSTQNSERQQNLSKKIIGRKKVSHVFDGEKIFLNINTVRFEQDKDYLSIPEDFSFLKRAEQILKEGYTNKEIKKFFKKLDGYTIIYDHTKSFPAGKAGSCSRREKTIRINCNKAYQKANITEKEIDNAKKKIQEYSLHEVLHAISASKTKDMTGFNISNAKENELSFNGLNEAITGVLSDSGYEYYQKIIKYLFAEKGVPVALKKAYFENDIKLLKNVFRNELNISEEQFIEKIVVEMDKYLEIDEDENLSGDQRRIEKIRHEKENINFVFGVRLEKFLKDLKQNKEKIEKISSKIGTICEEALKVCSDEKFLKEMDVDVYGMAIKSLCAKRKEIDLLNENFNKIVSPLCKKYLKFIKRKGQFGEFLKDREFVDPAVRKLLIETEKSLDIKNFLDLITDEFFSKDPDIEVAKELFGYLNLKEKEKFVFNVVIEEILKRGYKETKSRVCECEEINSAIQIGAIIENFEKYQNSCKKEQRKEFKENIIDEILNSQKKFNKLKGTNLLNEIINKALFVEKEVKVGFKYCWQLLSEEDQKKFLEKAIKERGKDQIKNGFLPYFEKNSAGEFKIARELLCQKPTQTYSAKDVSGGGLVYGSPVMKTIDKCIEETIEAAKAACEKNRQISRVNRILGKTENKKLMKIILKKNDDELGNR